MVPDCTGESIGYVLEYSNCRDKGTIRKYNGETSRSAYTRGKEHCMAVDNGEAGHPVVRPGWEEHKGKISRIVMRILTRHQKPLERPTMDTVKIINLSRGPQERYLNRKI